VGAAVCASAGGRARAGAPAAEEATSAPSYEEEVVVRAPARLPDGGSRGHDSAVEVVDAAALAASGAHTLQEALLRLPGVHLADEQGNPLQQDLSMRGLTASPVTGLPQGLSVFVDGVRVNEPAVEEVNFELVPLADIERVEIVRGPHALFGRNTLGGAIHVVTRRGPVASVIEAEIEGGSSLHQQVSARVAGPVGPLDGYLSFGRMSGGGWREDGGARALRSFGKLGVRRGATDAALSYQFQLDRVEQPGSLPLSMLRQDRRQNYTPGDFFRPRLHLLTLNARQGLVPGVSVAANGFFRALDGEQFNSSWLAANTRLFNATRSVGGTLQLEHRGRAGTLRHQLTAGAEATRSAVHVTVHQEASSRVATSEDGLPLPRVTSDVSDGQLGVGAFVQEHLRVAAGPLAGLAATASLRFDRIAHAIVDASPDDPGKATGEAAFSRWVPAAGVSWALSPRWMASGSYARGFRAPAFLELTCADPEAPCIGLQAGVAPDTSFSPLRPVRSRSIEAGLSGSPLDDVGMKVGAFRIDLADDIFGVTAPGTSQVVFQNVGATRRQGVELSLRAERGPVAVEGRYAYTLATFETDLALATPRTAAGLQAVRRGAELPLNPRHRADVECRVRALRGLVLTAGLGVVGPQYFRGDEANEAPKLAPQMVARAGAEARWRTWTAFLRASNVFDARYEVFGTFSTNGRAAGRPIEPFLTPGPPLRIVAGLRWELE